MPSLDEEIAEFLKERNEALLSGDVGRCMAVYAKYNPDHPPPSCREVAEIMMHKAITCCTDLPIEYRRQSKLWLNQRGSTSLDDGDL
jgi:hypothetical protein